MRGESNQEAQLAAWQKKVYEDRICPNCNKKYEGKQDGLYVWCEHCGARLYLGEVRGKA